MGFNMFSAQISPIAIDFGSSSIKLLQIGTGEKPQLIAAAEIPVHDSIRSDAARLAELHARELPRALREGKFRGKRVVCGIPSSQTFVQHMQLTTVEGLTRDELIKGQLQTQMGCAPHSVVVRAIDVGEVNRNGQMVQETICLAISREAVMRYVELLKRCKLELVGVHTQVMSMVRAFDHLSRRKSDENVTSLFADFGWSGMNVGITHGKQLVFARHVPIGGGHFDQYISDELHCDIATARAHRLSLSTGDPSRNFPANETPAEGMAILGGAMSKAKAEKTAAAATHNTTIDADGPATAVIVDRRGTGKPRELSSKLAPGDKPPYGVKVDLSELLDTISDELSMCLRYHQGLFVGRPIDRAIFVGGEARQMWFCQRLVKALRLPAQLGDPLSRLAVESGTVTPGLTLGQPQPGWAVACGLCTAPTDL
jgi:Tfp pilus assembly PilM family ATPase